MMLREGLEWDWYGTDIDWYLQARSCYIHLGFYTFLEHLGKIAARFGEYSLEFTLLLGILLPWEYST